MHHSGQLQRLHGEHARSQQRVPRQAAPVARICRAQDRVGLCERTPTVSAQETQVAGRVVALLAVQLAETDASLVVKDHRVGAGEVLSLRHTA